MTARHNEKVQQLREKHPTLRYADYAVNCVPEGLELTFTFDLAPDIRFTPRLLVPTPSPFIDRLTHRLAFLIGMVEMISYWKVACPARIEVTAGSLDEQERTFWETVIRHGLGEFFYVNAISPLLDFTIESSGVDRHDGASSNTLQRITGSQLILIGGGKDSIVSLELLSSLNRDTPHLLTTFAVNPIPASLHAVEAASLRAPLVARRSIDPRLLELNRLGYLNGHTPFSALLAFTSTLVAYLHGIERVVASNESSASEGNVEYQGFSVNHQYSKSLAFESLFSDYMTRLNVPVTYYSLLRPLNELQICALFSTSPHQHQIFRSCNRAQTLQARAQRPSSHAREGWCGECPKCIFTYLCLRSFLSQEQLVSIFGTDPSATQSFVSTSRELAGLTVHKPFECVGTFEEVRASLRHLFKTDKLNTSTSNGLANLAREIESCSPPSIEELLSNWDPKHHVPQELADIVRTRLKTATEGLRKWI
jgi:hypothetical protein